WLGKHSFDVSSSHCTWRSTRVGGRWRDRRWRAILGVGPRARQFANPKRDDGAGGWPSAFRHRICPSRPERSFAPHRYDFSGQRARGGGPRARGRRPRGEPPRASRGEPPLPPIASSRDEPEEEELAAESGNDFEERPRPRSWPPSTDARPPAEPRPSERARSPAVEPRSGERERSRPPESGRGAFSGEGRRPPRFAPERPKERGSDPRTRSGGEASTTVVRSGIIHGMAYTLYADGSIEAELPIGTVRFASIDELQDHVSRTGDEAD